MQSSFIRLVTYIVRTLTDKETPLTWPEVPPSHSSHTDIHFPHYLQGNFADLKGSSLPWGAKQDSN